MLVCIQYLYFMQDKGSDAVGSVASILLPAYLALACLRKAFAIAHRHKISYCILHVNFPPNFSTSSRKRAFQVCCRRELAGALEMGCGLAVPLLLPSCWYIYLLFIVFFIMTLPTDRPVSGRRFCSWSDDKSKNRYPTAWTRIFARLERLNRNTLQYFDLRPSGDVSASHQGHRSLAGFLTRAAP